MAGGLAVKQLDMLQIKQAARQEKEKSSQTRGRGMRSYTLDTIETYVSVTNDNPAPPDLIEIWGAGVVRILQKT